MDTPGPSGHTGPTAAQLRAEARRRKILEQGEQRINRILGLPPSATDSSPSTAHSSSSSPGHASDGITSPWQGTSGYNYVDSTATARDKVREEECTPQTASFTPRHDKPAISADNGSFTPQQQGQDYIELKRLLLIMTAASIGSLFEPNVMILFFLVEPVVFVLSFVSTVRGRRQSEYGDLQLTQRNRTMRQLAYAILSDLIVFLFSSIVTFALSQLYL